MLFQVAATSLISLFTFDGVSAGGNCWSLTCSFQSPFPAWAYSTDWQMKHLERAEELPHSLFFNFFSCQDDTSGDYKTALLNLCGSDWQNLGRRCWNGYREKTMSEQGSENVHVENLSMHQMGWKRWSNLWSGFPKLSEGCECSLHIKSYSLLQQFFKHKWECFFLFPFLSVQFPFPFNTLCRMALRHEINDFFESLNPL